MSFDGLLKAMRRRASSIVELPWRCVFVAAGKWAPSRARPWSATGADRVLVIAPHPDDEAIACSGTLLRHIASGERVVVAIATDGRLSKRMATPDEMAAVRRSEALLAARRLGIERLEWLGLREGAWDATELLRLLRALLERYEPTIVYAPSRVDFHPEHLSVAHSLARALESLDAAALRRVRVRVYQVQVPLTRILTNVVADVSAVAAQSAAALSAYESQKGSVDGAHRCRRYAALAHGVRGTVEEFWELSAQQYADVHRGRCDDWLGRFRGLRRFAWTDPLAYWVGNTERRRLEAVAAGLATPRSVA
jgi:LmbE family N-acetylglucosaminyl deacetylase